MSSSPPPKVQIRLAVPEDAPAVAKVHVETWKTTYRGIVPDVALDRMSVETDLAGNFGKNLQHPPAEMNTFVAMTGGGRIVGFCIAEPAGGPQDPPFTGELGALYVLKDFQGQGIGRRLFAEGVRHLDFHKHPGMKLWVLEQNPACRFYEHLGGEVIAKKVRPTAGTDLAAVAYGWKDLAGLRAKLASPPPAPAPGTADSPPEGSAPSS